MATRTDDFRLTPPPIIDAPPSGDSLVALTPMAMIQQAIAQGNIGVDVLERLWIIQKEFEEREAKRAFHRAMKLFKDQAPSILKNSHVKYSTSKGTTEYDHASLDHLCEQVIPALAAVGITHRWTTPAATEPGSIRIGCVLTHVLGYRDEPAELEGKPDESGGKNSLQARNSTVTYLQRYTLFSATGLAPKNADDDGKGGESGQKVDNLSERLEWLANARSNEELRRLYEQSYNFAEELGDTRAMNAIIEAKNKKYKELNPKVRGA